MMPILTPLRIPQTPLTEYQKEQRRFAQMQVALQRCKSAPGPLARFWLRIKAWQVLRVARARALPTLDR